MPPGPQKVLHTASLQALAVKHSGACCQVLCQMCAGFADHLLSMGVLERDRLFERVLDAGRRLSDSLFGTRPR